MLPGCSPDYAWEPVLEIGYSGMPMGGRPIHAEDGVHVKVYVFAVNMADSRPPNTSEGTDGFYSSTFCADKFIGYLDDRTAEEKAKPFFGYLAFSAPHWPVQAPKAKVEK
jgi:hypothetical protein